MSQAESPKAKFERLQRERLLAELERLKSRIENPELTQEQFDQIRQEVKGCQEKFAKLRNAS